MITGFAWDASWIRMWQAINEACDRLHRFDEQEGLLIPPVNLSVTY